MKLVRQFKIKIVLILLIIAITGLATYLSNSPKTRYKIPKINPDEAYQVANVLDGDTFEIKIGKKNQTVRMLGVDTPETVDPRKPVQCYGKEASDETKSILSHYAVTLKMDKTQSMTDKFGRLLAYVYREDGLFMNEFLLKNGLAREYTYSKPYMFQKEFKAFEMAAKEEKAGLWKKCE